MDVHLMDFHTLGTSAAGDLLKRYSSISGAPAMHYPIPYPPKLLIFHIQSIM